MFMMRFRLGFIIIDLLFCFLFFKVMVSIIFIIWLNYLFIYFGYLKIWLYRNVLVFYMFKDFKEKYFNNVCIIDCIEFKI